MERKMWKNNNLLKENNRFSRRIREEHNSNKPLSMNVCAISYISEYEASDDGGIGKLIAHYPGDILKSGTPQEPRPLDLYGCLLHYNHGYHTSMELENWNATDDGAITTTSFREDFGWRKYYKVTLYLYNVTPITPENIEKILGGTLKRD